MYPTSTWGKKYVLIPSENKQTTLFFPIVNTNIFRVLRPDPTTVVKLNGVIIPSGSFINNNYDFTSSQTNVVEADKGILVAQYFTSTSSGGCPSGNATPHDPEMIYLNPVEQTVTDVTVNSMQPAANTNINQHFLNVVVRNTGTGISSFKIDGITPPASSFTVLPQDNNYAYTRIWKNGGSIIATDPALSSGAHHLSCDSGFNAIAYGFGNAESYGYSAGTNLKDLYQQISVQSQYGIEASPSICTNSPFKFRVSLPYCADSIQWNLSNLPGPPTPTNPKIYYTSCTPGAGGPDSTTVVNGRVIYWYSLPNIYTFPTAGLYPVTITSYNTGSTLCGTSQDIDFELGVFDPPNAGFTNNQPGCIADPVQFYDTTITIKPNYRWDWNFGDPGSGAANTSTLQNPVHIFSTSGPHTVTLITTTTVGCFSSQASKIINVPAPPTAIISGANTICINTSSANNITFTGSDGISPYVFSYHINSGPIQTITSTGAIASVPINTSAAGTYTYYLDSVKNLGSTICNQQQTGNVIVNITPDATVALSSGGPTAQTVCNNNSITNITYAVGGSGTGGTVTNLPSGVTGTYSNGIITITGTPTVSGIFNYTVATTGPCVNPSITGTINVTDDGTLVLTSPIATSNQTLCINSPLTNITYTVGGSGTGGNVTGLPTGVAGTYMGGVITITGTPTISGIFNYTVLTTGPCMTPSLTGIINVTSDATIALSSPATTANQTICINNSITNITYAVGASGTGGNVTGLPAGVTGTYASGVITISGIPTVSGTFTYTASTTGPCVNPSLTGTITVTANATVGLTSPVATSNQTICINDAITNITYAVSGSGTGGSVTGLPAGVIGTYAGGLITIAGTPTVSGTFNYTVLTTGPCVNPISTGTINVTPNATIALTSAIGTNNQSLCINVPITNITYGVGGSGTGGSVSGLPSGVTGTYASGVINISGSPTVTGLFNYTVSTTGPCINPTATGTITVNPNASITLTSGAATINQVLCNNQPIIPITYQIGGGGTGATVGGLPAGVTGIYGGSVFTISGTPTVSGLFNYTVSTTGTCLQNAANGSILVNPKPTASFTTVGPYCSQSAVTFTPIFNITPTGSVVSWVWDYGDGAGPQVRPNGNPFTVTYPTPGTKIVTFKTISNNGCVSDIFTMPVTINSKPKAGFINPGACLADANAQFYDTSTVVGGTIIFWSWDFGDGSPIFAGTGPTHQNPTHAYAAVGQKTVTLIVTTNSGCKDTVIQQFFINGEVTRAAFITQNPNNLCSNRPVQIKENSLVNVGFLIRTDIYWDYVGAPTVFDQDNTPTPNKIYTHNYPNLQIDRTYRIRYFAYSGFNGVCQKDTIIDVLVRASPVAQFLPVPDVCLNGGTVVLNQGSASGGTGVYMGPGVTFSGGVYTFNPLATGVVVGTNNGVVYTVTSPTGCDSAKVQQIKVLAPPVVNSFAPIGNVCNNNTITFHQTYTNGDGTVIKWIYNWNDASPIQTMTTGADVTHVYTTSGLHTATLTLETGYGCRNIPFLATFTVNPLPAPTYTFSSSVCLPNATVIFTNTTPNTSENNYLWSFELPSTAPANTSTLTTGPLHIYTTQGPFNTNLVATNITTGCIGTSVTQVIDGNTIHPEPVLQFSNIADVCLNNGTVSFAALASETSGMAGGPGIFTSAIPGAITANGIFNPSVAGPGTHVITYTWNSAFNCPASITRPVIVLAPPVVNTFTTVGNRCETQGVVFHNTVSQGAGIIDTWIYDFGDGSPVTTVTNGNDITHVYLLPGTYSATLTLQTDYGCKSAPAFPWQVVVNALPRPDFTYTDTTCLPQAKVIFVNTTPNISDWAYNWNFDFPSTNPADQSILTQNVPYTYTTFGPHIVKLTATSGSTFCTAFITKPITAIHKAPLASFNISKPTICVNQSVTVTNNSTTPDGTITSWLWNYGDNTSPSQGQVQMPHTYTAPGTDSIRLTITNSFGCKDDSVRALIIYPYPVVNAGPDQFVLEGGSTILQATATGNELTYLWSASTLVTHLSSNIVLQPVATAVTDVSYKLTVTAKGGCSASDTVFVKVLKFPAIPNTFTPNNDGIHDFWDIQYLSSYPQNRVQVFTRTGQLVFESKGYTKPWDGTVNGKSLPFDTYYYIIEPGNGRKPITGFVTIIK